MEREVTNSNLRRAKIAGALLAMATLFFGLLLAFTLLGLIFDFSSSIGLIELMFNDFTLSFIVGLIFAVFISIFIGWRRGRLIYETKSELFLEGVIDANFICLGTSVIVLACSIHLYDFRNIEEVILRHFFVSLFIIFAYGLIPTLFFGSAYWWLLRDYIKALDRGK